ncbi:MAG: YfbR-like 5'-deoxynucleotidase [Lawsonibacter sp.]
MLHQPLGPDAQHPTLENVQEHSHQVAVLAHALAVIQTPLLWGQIDPGRGGGGRSVPRRQ